MEITEDGPVIKWSSTEQVKKGEDFHLVIPQLIHQDKELAIFCVFDGHNGTAAAIYTKENLLTLILKHSGDAPDGKDWLDSLPAAMAQAFFECHAEFAKKGETSGCTATVAIFYKWTITVAAVGDSRAVLHYSKGNVQEMTVDHRFEVSKEERQRVVQEGGMIARLKTVEGVEVGPLRSWPGGLCVSRSIGDIDCGIQITPLPHVRQVEVPSPGGRLIIASDGLWDAVTSQRATKVSKGLDSAKAAPTLVKESIRAKGLRDDITVLVVDLLPKALAENPSPIAKEPKEKKSFLKQCLPFGKKKEKNGSVDSNLSSPSLMNDHDSVKGGTLYQQMMKNGSIHSRGSYCQVCGNEVKNGFVETEASTRAGNSYCEAHMPS